MTSKDSHDPGWNDPPIFSYDKAAAIQAAAASKKGISLNKRVAFPIGSNSGSNKNAQCSSQSGVVDPSKPPPMSQSFSSSVTPMSSGVTQEVETVIGSTERLEKVLEYLQISQNCDEEIVKRIKIMEKMWTDGKLDETVQCRIYDLSKALFKNDTETADRIQMSLMVDFVSQCSTWMSGIRNLINKKKNDKISLEQ